MSPAVTNRAKALGDRTKQMVPSGHKRSQTVTNGHKRSQMLKTLGLALCSGLKLCANPGGTHGFTLSGRHKLCANSRETHKHALEWGRSGRERCRLTLCAKKIRTSALCALIQRTTEFDRCVVFPHPIIVENRKSNPHRVRRNSPLLCTLV